ncbi:trypsin-like serine protease [Corallococcus terminator]|uniref:Peptidase S1 n=1 Tax=Corallococcus terminator TaxID=2316733 RepID=A0A3A8JPS3_9BACT|nr:trypsin-like serine protease [Corallococcus terminator]RKG93760.1 peptidase S1 [Corallococcus terminator]
MASFPSKSAVSPRVSSRRFHDVWALGAVLGATWLGGCGGPEGLPVDAAGVGETAQEIVGGTNAAITDFPWQASLRNADGSHFCGGAILGPWYVLTAQHCVVGKNPGTMSLGAGSTTRSTMASTGQVVQVADFLLYPGYNSSTIDKDVALLRLASPLTLNTATVKGITMATAADVAAGRTNVGVIATATGWGITVQGGTPPDGLRKVEMAIVSEGPSGFEPLTEYQLATGGVANEGACHGDSGGPVVVNGASGRILAGLSSWGSASCARAGFPSVSARVSAIEPWVTNIRNRPVNHRLAEVLSVPAGTGWAHYAITVAAGTPSLNAQLVGGTGEADLYVHSATPTTSTYTCRSNRSGNAEYCAIPSPAAGTWYASVRSVSGVSNTALRVTTY